MDHIILRLSKAVDYSCGCSDSRPRYGAREITLTTSKEHIQKYFYRDQQCFNCTRNASPTTEPELAEVFAKKATFACEHESSNLPIKPLKGHDVQLRRITMGPDDYIYYYFWPIRCYKCALKHVWDEDDALEERYHFQARRESVFGQIAELNERMWRDDRRGLYRKADHPLKEKKERLLERDGDLRFGRATCRQVYWKPFQKRWGKFQGKGYLLKKIER